MMDETYESNFNNPIDETFLFINEDDGDYIIDLLCNEILRKTGNYALEHRLSRTAYSVSQDQLLPLILRSLPKPYTIIQEDYHIDKSYRDTYYMYYSNQHFHTDRYSRRLSFIRGKISFDDFFSTDQENEKIIKDGFMGCCVINPLETGTVGRTLISPSFLLDKTSLPAYIRLSEFKVHVFGQEFSVRAFPFRSQDQETMSCAEVTLLNLLEYYSNCYNDYRTIVPKDIIESEQRNSYERVLPTRGISYTVLTKVLSDYGFSPRLYNLSQVKNFYLSGMTRDDALKRILHCYIESGIPVALNLLPVKGSDVGHSVVCVGHGRYSNSLVDKAYRQKIISWINRYNCHPIVNSADFYEDYVVVDDNQPVYQIRNYNSLSIYSDMRVSEIAAPLYKRMFLDAPNASSIINTILQSETYGIENWSPDYLNKNEDIIIRLFMASSKSFKLFRRQTLTNIWAREVYSIVPMPKFVWVCELYRHKQYFSDTPMAFGEIVIDTTSVPNIGAKSLIMMHYPGSVVVRYPYQTDGAFDEYIAIEDDLIPAYRSNLDAII